MRQGHEALKTTRQGTDARHALVAAHLEFVNAVGLHLQAVPEVANGGRVARLRTTHVPRATWVARKVSAAPCPTRASARERAIFLGNKMRDFGEGFKVRCTSDEGGVESTAAAGTAGTAAGAGAAASEARGTCTVKLSAAAENAAAASGAAGSLRGGPSAAARRCF